MSKTRTLLFLCTGNSCRSQMAEGYARQMAGNDWRVLSAGIEAHGQNPRAIAAMQEDGVDISDQQSTVLTEAMLAEADVLVTVCGHADEHCPVVPGSVVKHHWPLPDPARAEGSEEEIASAFREVRDEIKGRVRKLLADADPAS
ncbi:arsenate reductase (thioredoxin) [Halorhodospira halophila]|uniref:Protein tyrosine phosphatase n=1 Tax=Halorhodospira halophila (strain DSM 244 / SL1) TaxID=349124 RepID=A1WT74_HALHL|nr:arsenate reductase (thioredoxin) [Halorhodospira halophila]ABM60886.1 protein tyrosine phosphatase [Halorhodospira halophila SL1]MBK1728541.1 arsenate reductase (thioredoxin) [Halorhodospira halophila]